MATQNKKYSPDNPYAKGLYSADNPYAKTLTDGSGEDFANSAGKAFQDRAGTTLVNNILSLPAAGGEVLAKGLAGTSAAIQGGISAATGGEFDFNRRANEEMQGFPNKQLNSIPRPTIQELGSAVRAIPSLAPGGQSPQEAFNENINFLNQQEAQQRQQHPGASLAGDVSGDALSLMLGRNTGNLSKNITSVEQMIMGKKPADILFGAAQNLEKVPKGTMAVLDEFIINNKGIRSLLRGAGRSVETGFEAAALDLVKGDDPAETFGYAFGAQAAGSGSLGFLKAVAGSGSRGSQSMRLSAAAVAAAGLWQMTKQVTPGGDNSPIESIKSGYDKVILALVFGVASGASGLGRLRNNKGVLSEQMPKFADAMTSLPRGAMISLLEDMANAPPPQQKVAETTLQQLMEDPSSFSDEQLKKLNSSFENGKLISVVDDLMSNDEEFAMRMLTIITDQEQEAKKQSQLGPLPPDFGAQ